MSLPKSILILTPFFSPNIGGVETHLSDLVEELVNLKYHVYVHTFSPITTPNTNWQSHERQPNLIIRRYHWFGRNLFNQIEHLPLFDFLYLSPYLFVRTYLWLLTNHRKIDDIHSQGLNAAFAGFLLQKIFHKKHIVSTHALYTNSNSTLLQKIICFILNRSDHILSLSQASTRQLISWGVNPAKITPYRYWVNIDNFKPSPKPPRVFTILFVGRLIKKKGVRLVIKLAATLPKIRFQIIGTGPEAHYIINHPQPNLEFIGKIENLQLPKFYQQASLLIQPALYPEGFSRVFLEALSSGLPVIASNLGSIPEIVDDHVSRIFRPTLFNFKKYINQLMADPKLYQQLKNNCRPYALKYYSHRNVDLITQYY